MSHQQRKLHINAFLSTSGHHGAAWRHPSTQPERGLDIGHFQRLARTAERGLFDSLFLADGYSGRFGTFEPFTLLSALALATEHIGLIATVGTTYNDPFHVARQFASLDHISRGRAGWNIVTGAGSAAHNFSRAEHPEHSERYETAEEFVELVKQLWDSWEDNAVVYDKVTGVRIDESKVHEIHFRGEHYTVRGPLNIPRPPQGYPVLVQAGSSETGKELAAKTAEAIFTAQQTLGEAQAFYRDVKSRLAKYGRRPEQLVILPGLSPILADTEAEALDIEEELFQLLNPENAVKGLSQWLGFDLTPYSIDGPLPLDDLPGEEKINGHKARYTLMVELARRENLTIRQLTKRIAGARGHFTFTGTPLQLADLIEQWFHEGGSDGFNLMPQLYPDGLETFVSKVVPELQNRGLFRTEYEGTTLRDRLGLEQPANPRARAGVEAG